MVRGVRNWRRRTRGPLVLALALVGVGAGASASAAGSPPAVSGMVRIGPARPLGSAADVGAASASLRMHLTIALKPRNPPALAAYARAVSTPGSAIYHRYLTPARFAARFGPSEAQLRMVEASMRAHGLIPGPVSANRLAVPVTATAAQLERAFSLSFRRVALRGGQRAVVANAAPALDAAIAPEVQAVVGLTSVPVKPLLARRTYLSGGSQPSRARTLHGAGDGPQACPAAASAAASQGAYTADQVASAYGLANLYATGAQGQGETIAIYELETYDPQDVAFYQACYGTAARIANVPVDGGAGSGPGSGEAALDIEQAVGLAPKANVVVYEAPNSSASTAGSGPYDAFSAIVTQDRAQVVSISWGQCEQAQGSNVLSAESTLFEEAATQGQSIIAASGDEGSEDCNGLNGTSDNQPAVDDPGSQPFVTGVGGTTMQASGPPPSEIVWNHAGASSGPLVGQGGAGGGGVSHAWSMPGYQSGAARSLNIIGPYAATSGCGNSGGYCRQTPDVAADADPARGYIIYWNGAGQVSGMPDGWQAVGGTSAAAPVWAALLADVDSSSACRGSAVGFANPAMYAAASNSYGGYFNDVVSGNNDFTGAHGGMYPAGSGYDMTTGLGTPKAGALAAPLCGGTLRVNNPGSQLSTVGRPVLLRVSTTGASGGRLQFYGSQLPPGLSMAKGTGRITGRPTRVGSWSSGVAALGTNLALRGAFFPWRVVGAPAVSRMTLSGLGAGRPTLSFLVGAGRAAPALHVISIQLPSGLSFGRPAGRVLVFGPRGRRVAASARLVGRRLRLLLAVPARQIRIRISTGLIRGGARLASAMRRRRPPRVIITVLTADSAGQVIATQVRIRPTA